MQSMTGYARVEQPLENGAVAGIELKTVNAKGFDLYCKLPSYLNPMLVEVRRLVAQRVKRGHVQLAIDVTGLEDTRLTVDTAALQQAVAVLAQVKQAIRSRERLRLRHIIPFKNIFQEHEAAPALDTIQPAILAGLDKALLILNQVRAREGKHIQADLAAHAAAMRELVGEISALRLQAAETFKQKTMEKLHGLLSAPADVAGKIDEQRLEQEVLYLVLKSDIAEELARLTAHLQSFTQDIKLDKPMGKDLIFIAQEMLREANTICSKTEAIGIKERAMALKVETERIKEQLFNVE